MSCSRAFEIHVQDLLAEPESLELGVLESHSAGCPDCASELALQRGPMARLRGGDAADEARHPSDALLLGLRRDPDSSSDLDRALVPFTRESHEDRRALWQLCERLSAGLSR